MSKSLTEEEQQTVLDDLEERADYLTVDELRRATAANEFFKDVQRKLLGRGTKLLVGPRGCGKTHMMRFAQLACADKSTHPFAVYVSFNRYYRLEPMLHAKSDALRLFQLWSLANTVSATVAAVKLFSSQESASRFEERIGVNAEALGVLGARLETSSPLDEAQEALAQVLTIPRTTQLLELAAECVGRKRCVLLLDDAALTLTPEYLVEFFDIVRAIKSQRVSPKASVYPGTTEYGPRFHAVHEADTVPVWLSLDDEAYESTMAEIAALRFSESAEIPREVLEQLRFAAFGIPRAYLAMLRQFRRLAAPTQQATNIVIEQHIAARLDEYDTLAKKMPKFASLVSAGRSFFEATTDALAKENRGEMGTVVQLTLGLQEEKRSPLRERMLSLLLEAGLLYEHPKVAHGEDRTYRRFTPHLAALMQRRAFSSGTRGVSPARVVAFLRRPRKKHPLRRKFETLMEKAELEEIRLNLPPCAKCNQERLSEEQKFCHNCGAQLLTTSTFENYLQMELSDVPGFTPWQKAHIVELTGFRTIGDLLTYQDPGSELRKIRGVGKIRANRMLDLVNAHVDEYFS